MGIIVELVLENGVRCKHELNLGDVVLTYDGHIAQIRELDFAAGIRLSTGHWADPYELVPIKWLGYRANEVMKGRGKSKL